MNTRKNEFRFLVSNNLSLIGDCFTEVASYALVFDLTHSAVSVGNLFIFRAFAVFVSGLLVPALSHYIRNKKNWVASLDFIRAVSILFLVFFPLKETVYFVAFFNALISGFYHPNKQAGVQTLIVSENRPAFLAQNQAWANGISLIAPLLAGSLLTIMSPPIIFLIDALSFIVSGSIILKLDSWHQEALSVNILERIQSGYSLLLKDTRQFHLLKVRLILLLLLASFDIFKINTVTVWVNLNLVNFSFANGMLSTFGAIGIILASLCMKRWPNALPLNKRMMAGIYIVMVGILGCILIPTSNIYFIGLWVFLLSIVFFGLGWARVAVHSLGFEITDKSVFTEVVASSDAIARLWQTSIYSLFVYLSKVGNWHYIFLGIILFGIVVTIRFQNILLKPNTILNQEP